MLARGAQLAVVLRGETGIVLALIAEENAKIHNFGQPSQSLILWPEVEATVDSNWY